MTERTLYPQGYLCPSCGGTMDGLFTGTVEFSVEVGCPFCGTIMDRLDPLGILDSETRGEAPPRMFRGVYPEDDPYE